MALLAFVKLPTRNYAIAVGIALACEALVKAALFYVSIFAITTIAILFFITNAEKQTIRRHRAAFLVLVAFLPSSCGHMGWKKCYCVEPFELPTAEVTLFL